MLGPFFTKKICVVNGIRKMHYFKLGINWAIGSLGIIWIRELENGRWKNKSEEAGAWGSPCIRKEGFGTESWTLRNLNAHNIQQVQGRQASRHCHTGVSQGP